MRPDGVILTVAGRELYLDLAGRLGTFIKANGLGRAFPPDQGFALPSGDTVGPDIAIILKDRWEEPSRLARGDFIALVPDLVVEVLSPGNARYDRGEKKGIYERNGVREYWLLDPRGRRLTVCNLFGEKYDTGKVFEEPDTVISELFPGRSIALKELLP